MPDIRHRRRPEAWEEQLRKGGLELAILLSMASSPRRYGLEILRTLEEETELVVTEGTIYPILGRLARDGLLEAEWVQETKHPRKYYRLTRAGRRRLEDMISIWSNFTHKIDRLIDLARERK